MMSWGNNEKKESTSHLYVRIADGQSVKGVFVGEPFTYKRHWIEGSKKYWFCHGDACQKCQEGHKPNWRFKANFVTVENGALVAKIFDGSYGSFKELQEKNKKRGLENWSIEVSRVGLGNQTRYTFDWDKELNEEGKKKVQAVQLQNLEPRPEPSKTDYKEKEFSEYDGQF